MKHLFTGVAVVAVLAVSAPVGAQPANPSGGNSVGMPGPSPGGPGLTPYSTGTPPPAATRRAGCPREGRGHREHGSPLFCRRRRPRRLRPPTRRRQRPLRTVMRARSHGKMASHHPSHFPNVQGDNVANQLNQAEVARLQSGNFTSPPAPEMSSGATPVR
jgi:hypothetical protein